MRVGGAIWIRPDSSLHAGLSLWADGVGRIAETMQVDDDKLQLVMTFCDPIAVDVSPLWPEHLVPDRSRPGKPF